MVRTLRSVLFESKGKLKEINRKTIKNVWQQIKFILQMYDMINKKTFFLS